MLLSLLFAALLALAGYAALVAWHRGPVSGVAEAPPPRARELPAPEHLPARQDRASGDARPADASTTAATDAVDVTIAVNAAPAAPNAGVLIVADDTLAPWAWLPFGDGGVSSTTRSWSTRVPRRPLRLFVAGDRITAASTWWASKRVPGAPAPGDRIEIDAAAHVISLRLELPDSAPLAETPFALRRVGEPAWRLAPSGPAGLRIDPAQPWTLTLGTGDYELEPLIGGPWQPATVQVRAALEQQVTFARRPRADRP